MAVTQVGERQKVGGVRQGKNEERKDNAKTGIVVQCKNTYNLRVHAHVHVYTLYICVYTSPKVSPCTMYSHSTIGQSMSCRVHIFLQRSVELVVATLF